MFYFFEMKKQIKNFVHSVEDLAKVEEQFEDKEQYDVNQQFPLPRGVKIPIKDRVVCDDFKETQVQIIGMILNE